MIKVYSSRAVHPNIITISNQYENQTRYLDFDLSEIPEGNRYLIVTYEKTSYAFPIGEDGRFEVTSSLTWEPSKTYYGNIVVSNIPIDDKLESSSALFVSDTIKLIVSKNYINAKSLSEQPFPKELQIVYDDLLNLKKDIEQKLQNGEFNGEDGIDGKSAYELAVENGFKGTEEEWLESLRYDHSDEFKQLAEQVKENVLIASKKATEASESSAQALESKNAASISATQASNSAQAAKTSETSALQSKNSAAESATAAKTSEVNAKTSEDKSKISETNAKASETASKESETNAKSSETATSRMAQEANSSAQTATEKATLATESATAAKASESNAKLSETNAKTSETNAKQSELNAKASETATGQVVADATEQADRAKTEADRAKTNADTVASSTQKIDKNESDITQLKEDLVNKTNELKEDIQTLSNDGRINVNGTDHNYFFGGGINYSDLIISDKTFTKVFPIEHGKTYRIINTGNICVIGFANEEYVEVGKVNDNVEKKEKTFDFTNDSEYTFLYVFYSTGNKEKQGDCLLEVYTNIVLKENLDVLNQYMSNAFNKITIVDGNIRKGYYVNNDGHIYANNRSDAHTDIKVRRGYKIRIKNAYCANNRSICAYNENGDYVKTLATNTGESAFNAEFDVDDYDKISVTSKSNDEIVIEYIGIIPMQATDSLCESIDERNATSNGTGNYYNMPAFVLNQGEFTDGYLAGDSVFESTTLYYTPYISVLDEQVITLKNAFVGGFTKAVFYDADKKYIGHVKADDNYYIATYDVRIPYGAHYMRFNVNKATDFNLVGVEYTQKIERNYKPLNLVKRWYSNSFEKIDQLFKKATEKPICCIIDDDSPSADAMETFATVMESNGVQGTIACLTAIIDSQQDLKSKLLELERRGHQVVLHGYTQNEAYKIAKNVGDENYKIAEDDFVHGLHDLISAGFVDCKFWVTPYGVSQKCLQKLARKWGMECLITTAKKEFNRTDGKFSRYEIQRSGLNASDTGTLSQEELIALADKCAVENGWLLVNTHITNGWNNDFTRINEFISHCKEKGFEFMTLGEAWRIRKPIYDWYDTF